jgi:hypothetical protein
MADPANTTAPINWVAIDIARLVDDNYLGRLTTTILAGRARPPGALG